MMNNDFHPFYVRVGDSWTKIDYSKHPSRVDEAARARQGNGPDRDPASWYLDDLPPMMFMKAAPNSHGFVNPRQLEEIWRDQFDWVYREYDYAVFTITIHRTSRARPQNLLMLERLYDYIKEHEGVRFVTFEEIADDFAKRYPRGEPPVPCPARRQRRCARTATRFRDQGALGGWRRRSWTDRASRRQHRIVVANASWRRRA